MIFPRLGIYQLLLLQEMYQERTTSDEPRVYCVLLNLTGENPVEGWQSPPPGISIRPIVINLRNESASELLNEIEKATLDLTLLA